MDDYIKPNNTEQFLNLAYSRFYDLYEEILAEEFWSKLASNRFARIKDGFSVYAELINYEPLKKL